MRRPYCQCSTCTVTNKCIHTPAFVEVVCPLSPWCSTSGCFRLGLLQFSRLENANQENITTSSWQEEHSRLLIVVSRLSSASLHHRAQKVHLIKWKVIKKCSFKSRSEKNQQCIAKWRTAPMLIPPFATLMQIKTKNTSFAAKEDRSDA